MSEPMVDDREREEAIKIAAKLSPDTVYEIIRRDGVEELERTNISLFWSGISAGFAISASVLGEAILHAHLPDTPVSYLVENLGYSFGFIAVIMGRMQLFTENTITTVLPYLRDPRRKTALRILELWSIVLFANVVGAFAISFFYAYSGGIAPETLEAMNAISRHAMDMSAGQSFVRAIPAGMLVAAMVWMLPQAGGASLWVIVISTWLIAAGDFAHIVAGSVEMALLTVQGRLSVMDGAFGFFLPVLAGNVIGGTLIFSMLVFGQVREELMK